MVLRRAASQGDGAVVFLLVRYPNLVATKHHPPSPSFLIEIKVYPRALGSTSDIYAFVLVLPTAVLYFSTVSIVCALIFAYYFSTASYLKLVFISVCSCALTESSRCAHLEVLLLRTERCRRTPQYLLEITIPKVRALRGPWLRGEFPTS